MSIHVTSDLVNPVNVRAAGNWRRLVEKAEWMERKSNKHLEMHKPGLKVQSHVESQTLCVDDTANWRTLSNSPSRARMRPLETTTLISPPGGPS